MLCPITCEDVRGEFTPVGRGIEVIIHREDAKVVETVCAEFRSVLEGVGYVIMIM